MEPNRYQSCIKINGVPILPPIVTPDLKRQIKEFQQRAIEIEKQLGYNCFYNNCMEQLRLAVSSRASSSTYRSSRSVSSNDTSARPSKRKEINLTAVTVEVSEHSNGVIRVFKSNGITQMTETATYVETVAMNRPLIRSNSYVLDTPSPILLAHLQKEKEKCKQNTEVPKEEVVKPIINEPVELEAVSLSKYKLCSNPKSEANGESSESEAYVDLDHDLENDLYFQSFSESESEIKIPSQQLQLPPKPNSKFELQLHSPLKTKSEVQTTNLKSDLQFKPLPEPKIKSHPQSTRCDRNTDNDSIESTKALLYKTENQDVGNKIAINILPNENNKTLTTSELSESETFLSTDISNYDGSHNDNLRPDGDSPPVIPSIITSSKSGSSGNSPSTRSTATSKSASANNSPNRYLIPTKIPSPSGSLFKSTPRNISSEVVMGRSIFEHKRKYYATIPNQIDNHGDDDDNNNNNNNNNNKMTKEQAAHIIGAGVRGYLTRRLIKTEKVQIIVKTIRDCILCAIDLHNSPYIDEADIELHRRLIFQLTSACDRFYDIFFELSIKQQMEIISLDRQRLIKKAQLKVLKNYSLKSTFPKKSNRI